MPDGEKLGDGYIEVHYEVNDRELDRARAQVEDAQRFMYQYQRDGDEEAAKVRERLDRDVAKSRQDLAIKANKAALDATKKQESDAAREIERMKADIAQTADQQRNKNHVAELSKTMRDSQKIYDDFDKQRVKTQLATDRLSSDNTTFVHNETERLRILSTTRGAKARADIETKMSRAAGDDSARAFSDAISVLPGRLENTVVSAFSNPYIAAAVSVAALALGTAFIAAFEGALGLGEIGAGIALAISSSDELKQAGAALGHQFLGGLQDAAGILIPPIRDAMNQISQAAGSILSEIHQGFYNLAPAIPALTNGIIEFTYNLAQMFNGVSKNLEPVLEVIGNEMLPKISQSIQDFFVNLSKDKESLIIGIRILTGLVQGLILGLEIMLGWWQMLTDIILGSVSFALKTVGMAIKDISKISIPGLSHVLGDVGDKFLQAGDAVHQFGEYTQYANTTVAGSTGAAQNNADAIRKQAGAAEYAAEKNKALGGEIAGVKGKSDQMSGAQQELRQQVDSVTQSVQKQSDAVHAQIDASQDWNTKLLDLKDSLKQNGATLDIHTRAGLANRDALEAAAASSRDLWEEDVASGVPVQEATRRAKERTDQLLAQFGQTGALKDMTQQLIDKYGAIPTDINTVLQLTGYDTVNARLQDLKVQQYALQQNIPINQAMGIVRDEAKGLNRAEGGPIFGPGGPKDDIIPAWLSNGEYVINAEQTKKHYNLIRAINQDKLPQYASGGLVNFPFPVDVLKTAIPDIFAGIVGGQGVKGIQDWLMNTASHLPYVWGAVGPNAFDCSGLVGEVWARLTGHPSNRRYFVTGGEQAFLGAQGFKPGPGGVMTVGMSSEHTMGSVGGLLFEAQNPADGIKVGGGTSNISSFPVVMHLDPTASGGGASLNGQVGAWIKEAQKYVSIEWPAGLATLIQRESGGNPNARNLWDGNAKAGDPAVGLMQLIGSTFDRFRNPALPPFNYNPISNIVAGMNYIHSRYGSLNSVQQAHSELPPMGYDRGGYLQPGWNLAYNGLGVPEPVGWPDDAGTTKVIINSKDGWLENAIDVRIEKSNQKIVRTLRAGPGRK